MEMSILPKFLTLKWNILRTIWHIEVGDGSFVCIFHNLSFELNFFFDRSFPLNSNLQTNSEKKIKITQIQTKFVLKLSIHFKFGMTCT